MSSFDQLIQTLKNDGKTEKEIGEVLAEIMRATSSKLYTELMLELTDEERKQIDGEDDDKKAKEMILSLYQKHTGKTPEQTVNEFKETFAKGFLEQYEKDRASS